MRRPEVLPTAHWADRVAADIAERLAAQPDLVLCLPTGATPLPAYERLPAALRERGASMAAATVVLLDEYLGLPPGHPARCEVVLRATLLERLDRPPAGFVTFDIDATDPAAACAAFEAAIDHLGGLDLVLLGLGSNGHVGMNEPGTRPDAPTRVVELAPSTVEAARAHGAEPPPTAGVTLGMARILAAREVWLLATGEGKAAVAARALDGPASPELPASLLLAHPRLRVLLDEAAASRLAAQAVAE